MIKTFIILFLIMPMGIIHSDSFKGDSLDIKIRVNGIEKFEGQIKIGLYSEDNVFPDTEDVIAHQYIKVTAESVVTSFKMESGKKYAIAVHHDLNMDGTLNKNIFGKPTEPYGFSNNPNIWFRAPSFEECAFIPQKDQWIEIRI